MCLAVPAKIVSLDGTSAVIETEGVRREASVALLSDVRVGDYVLLHAGFAIQKWSQEDVSEWRQIVEEMERLDGE
jgi:hydrogenase expression/formation protein HypC